MSAHALNNEPLNPADWQLSGEGKMTPKQMRMLNAVCGDLSSQLAWHGKRMSKDDWRHMLSGTMLGWRMMPAIDRGEGAAGFIMLGGSSLSMTKTLAADAITVALSIGDQPESQGLASPRVRWSDTVLRGLGFNPRDFAEAA